MQKLRLVDKLVVLPFFGLNRQLNQIKLIAFGKEWMPILIRSVVDALLVGMLTVKAFFGLYRKSNFYVLELMLIRVS